MPYWFVWWRLFELQKGLLLTYARPGDSVHISEMFRLVRGTAHILDVLDVLHRDRLALRIHDGAFSAMDLTARHPRTGELLSTVKFMVQTLAAAGELQRDLQRELTYDGLRAAEAKGSKGGRRPAVPAGKTADVRAAYLENRSIAALARDHGVSRGAIRTVVADLLPDHTAIEQDAPAPELPVTLDVPGKVADFLRATDLEPAERAALDQGAIVRRGQGYPARQRRPRHAPPAPQPLPPARRRPGRPCGPGSAQGPPRVREPCQCPSGCNSRTMINLSAKHGSIDPRGRTTA
ncbi:recombinase family protein [Streptomyces sp. NPDC058618]